jgi:hypothetical protein
MDLFQQQSFFDTENEEEECSYENHLDCVIEIIEQLATSADRPIYDKLFKSVVTDWQNMEAPVSQERITNAWEFLGVINYHGSDHFFCELTISELECTVRSKIRDLPLHEQILFNLANGSACFDWDEFKRDTSTGAESMVKYLTHGETFEETVRVISKAIRSHAPVYYPYD